MVAQIQMVIPENMHMQMTLSEPSRLYLHIQEHTYQQLKRKRM